MKALALLALCSCATHTVVVEARELRRNIPELTTQGYADVTVLDYGGGRPDAKTMTLRADQRVVVKGERKAIAELVAGCTSSDDASGCPLGKLGAETFQIRTYQKGHGGGPVLGVIWLGSWIGGGIGYFATDEGTRGHQVSKDVLYGATGLTVGIVGYIIVSCFVVGCRD